MIGERLLYIPSAGREKHAKHLLVHPATMSNGISLSNHLDRDSRGDQRIDSDFT